MKTAYIKTAVFLMAVILIVFSTGCNKNEESNPVGGNQTDAGLVGTWNLTEATINPGTDSAQVFNQFALQLSGVSMV